MSCLRDPLSPLITQTYTVQCVHINFHAKVSLPPPPLSLSLSSLSLSLSLFLSLSLPLSLSFSLSLSASLANGIIMYAMHLSLPLSLSLCLSVCLSLSLFLSLILSLSIYQSIYLCLASRHLINLNYKMSGILRSGSTIFCWAIGKCNVFSAFSLYSNMIIIS